MLIGLQHVDPEIIKKFNRPIANRRQVTNLPYNAVDQRLKLVMEELR